MSTDKKSSSGKSIEISQAEIFERLQCSSTFSWRVYRERDGIRHIGILIRFNGKPFCTVDFGVENLCLQCFIACESKVRIHKVPLDFESRVDCEGVMECLNTTDESLRREAKEKIRTFVARNREVYSLLRSNCRDNTRDSMNLVCSSGQCNGVNWRASRQMLRRTQSSDRNLFFVAASGAVILVLYWLLRRYK